QPRLVRVQGREERLGVPRRAGRVGGEEGGVGAVQLVGEGEDALGRGAAPVEEHDGYDGLAQRRAGGTEGRPGVGVGGAHAGSWLGTWRGGRRRAICSRRASYCGGSLRLWPSASAGS